MIHGMMVRCGAMLGIMLVMVGFYEWTKEPTPEIVTVAIATEIAYPSSPLVLMSTSQYTRAYNVTHEIAGKIVYYAEKHEIDVPIAFGLVHIESNFNPRAISSAGARGLTQLMRPTAGDYLRNPTDSLLYDIDTNLDVGMYYLSWLIDRYDGDLTTALVAYNSGLGTVERLRRVGWPLPMRYPRMVMRSASRVAD